MRKYTDKELEWIKANLDAGVFRNQNHFTDVFNALFGKSVSYCAMNTMLHRRGWSVKTKHNTSAWTYEMDAWLKDKYDSIGPDFIKIADEFNSEFLTEKSNCCIQKHLIRIGIHKTATRKTCANKGRYKAGKPREHLDELPIGTIRYNNKGGAYIKVKLCNGENTHGNGGHNYKEPWWKPFNKKVWEDNFGEVPEGHMVCSLSGKSEETDPNMLCLIDRRSSARMAKNGWWDADHPEIKRTAVAWCNLYYALKDQGET